MTDGELYSLAKEMAKYPGVTQAGWTPEAIGEVARAYCEAREIRRLVTRPQLAELRTLIAIVENDRGRKCTMATEFVDALESLLPPIGAQA